jgi:hypothetical protein
MDLASILGVHLRDLLGDGASPEESISIAELPERINAHVARQGISVEQFEDQVGWELRDFLSSPINGAAELPIVFLQAVASPLGIDWLSLVPDEPAA